MSIIKLSIIIATYNRHQELKLCIDSLLSGFSKIKLLPNVEIRVVDQSENIFSHAKDYESINQNFYYQRISIKNASYARNVGARESRGEYLWFMDDDAILCEFNASALFRGLTVIFISWIQKRKIFDRIYLFNNLNILRRSGTPFYILKKIEFNKVSGFNERIGPGTIMRGGEDLDLLLRVNRVCPIREFCTYGSLSHPLINSDQEKKSSYYFARGYVLAINKEYFLFILNLMYDLRFSFRDGISRPKQLIKGFMLGMR